jgi:putative SOS response-associated peptidase YedK
MCGRYDLNETRTRIRVKFNVEQLPIIEPSPDVRPTEMRPIVRLTRHGDGRECVLARWGLVPHWAKDIKFGVRCINARAESAATLPAFKEAFQRKRCLIPATAFFEWSGEKGHKTKWRITVKDEPLFAFAGLWEWWRDPNKRDEPGVETYTILTTEPNDILSDIHDRMPVIVRQEDYDAWLEDGPPESLRPLPSELIEITRA